VKASYLCETILNPRFPWRGFFISDHARQHGRNRASARQDARSRAPGCQDSHARQES
jgi:hypothetical protein